MIDEKITLKKFKHTSETLTNGSHKFVWATCEECGYSRKMPYFKYIKSNGRCKKCSTSGKPLSYIGDPCYDDILADSIANKYIDEGMTFKVHGYHSIILKPGSHSKIFAICKFCKDIREIAYKEYNRTNLTCQKCLGM